MPDMEFIETSLFTRIIYNYLSEDEYFGLQVHLLNHPESGKIIRGSGGVRKIRWSTSGKREKWRDTSNLLLEGKQR